MSEHDHALLAPSSAARLVKCPGSRAMAAAFPREDTQESREGVATHWAWSELQRGDQVALGQVAPNGVTLDDVMIDSATSFYDWVQARGVTGQPKLIETTIRNAWLHQENWGTPDLIEFSGMTMYVDDLKHGFGYVSEFENWQLLNYAALKLAELYAKYGENIWELNVEMGIHQPRCYHRGSPHRVWKVKASELRPYIATMQKQFALAMTDDAPCIANSECEHCPAVHACEAAIAGAWEAVPHAYRSIPLVMSPDEKALQLTILQRAAERLKAVITGMKTDVQATISTGHRVSGYRVANGHGATVWLDEEQAKQLGLMFGVKVVSENMRTPIQVGADLKKMGIPPEVIASYSRHQTGAARLELFDAHELANVFK